MKLCIVGDSHLAAFKNGWNQISSEFQNVNITFFGSQGASLSCLEAENGALVPRNSLIADRLAFTSGGLKEVRAADYEHCLLVGLGLLVPRLDERHSGAFVDRALSDAINLSLSMRTAKRWRSISEAPISVVHTPLPAPSKNEEPSLYDRPISYDRIVEVWRRELAAIASATLLAQPPGTRGKGLSTKRDFSAGSLRLDTGQVDPKDIVHHESDNVHMNAKYGAAFLRAFFINRV